MNSTLSPDWAAAIARIENGSARRVVVIGTTDAGKSSFIRAALTAAAEVGAPLPLIDLDPGQKMMGPPGTAILGTDGRVDRMVFIGSTSAGEVSRIAGAAKSLARSAAEGFIANTAGFVRGLGAKLQSCTIAALQPDLVVAIGEEELLKPILDAHPTIPVVRLERSPFARRKSPSERAGIRQGAFAAALERAERVTLGTADLSFTPGPPASFRGPARPICVLAAADGEAMSIGILQEVGKDTVVIAETPLSTVAVIGLGKMWARPTPAGWQLLEQLSPAWEQPASPDTPPPDVR